MEAVNSELLTHHHLELLPTRKVGSSIFNLLEPVEDFSVASAYLV